MRIGISGKRGLTFVGGLKSVAGVSVEAFADPDPVARGSAEKEYGISSLHVEYEQMLDGVDAVIVASPMQLHAPQSIQALGADKHVLSEVTLAVDRQQLAELDQATRESKRLFSIAENYCYFEENLIVLELVRKGLFGDLYFGEGDYVHEVRFLHRNPDGTPTWRMKYQVGAPGNTYCTHELGPLMQWFRAIDPGLKIESVACFGTGVHTDPSLSHDDTSITLIKLSNGGLLKLRLDMVSSRPHRIGYSLQGTEGVYESEGGKRAWFGENRTVSWNEPEREWTPLTEYSHYLAQPLQEELSAAKTHGHGGADYLTGRRFAQAILGEREQEISASEGIEWTLVGLLSQESIMKGGASVPMPVLA